MPVEILSQSQCQQFFGSIQQAAKSLGVSDVEALFGAHFGALTRFANNTIHQNVAEQDRWISIRVALDQRTARATTNRFDSDSIRGAVEQALALARSAAANPDLLPLTEPSVISETKRFDAATAAATPEYRGRAVAEAIRIVESAGQTAAGIYSTGQSIEAIFNSRGVAAWHAETMAQFSITAMADDSSGWAKASAVSHESIDSLTLARSAAEKARLSHDPQEIAP
jgi:predicted Zn-dependent protease